MSYVMVVMMDVCRCIGFTLLLGLHRAQGSGGDGSGCGGLVGWTHCPLGKASIPYGPVSTYWPIVDMKMMELGPYGPLPGCIIGCNYQEGVQQDGCVSGTSPEFRIGLVTTACEGCLRAPCSTSMLSPR